MSTLPIVGTRLAITARPAVFGKANAVDRTAFAMFLCRWPRANSENTLVTVETPAKDLSRYAWLSVVAAAATITMKTAAYFVTGSVGLLSDAAESVVNLAAAVVALVALKQAAKPADSQFAFGRSKAEYFSSTVEGTMIFVAAGFIVVSAVGRIIRPAPIDNLGPGLAISVAASVVNGIVAVALVRAGRRWRSPALVADGRHLGTDVVTSVGVILGVGLVVATEWDVLDPVVALLVGLNILVTGWRLLRGSIRGLMDVTLSAEQNQALIEVLAGFATESVRFHGLQTRAAGQASFANVHMLVPGSWTVGRGHELAHDVAEALSAAVPGLDSQIHVEPIEDPRSYEDIPTGSLSVGDGDLPAVETAGGQEA